ncbi:U7 snRNA-associated Sm-like protein LSm10 [Rhagoletis pomonella]|uniref:U7 snRNA-associated Sm-like protein LSm10 n=1 Tax=Rhagoletis pomonella TaxID=28610 RepID=UPI00177B769E|nr:U7 snRNA-associated Sm-like protein LSm10 [Rhagoletis pomonella]
MQKASGKETYLVTNTLNCIPFLLDGQSVLIDLLNENSVAGRIDADGTDGYMNINLRDVVFIDRNGQQYPFEQFMVRPRVIRQIHIPAHIEAESAIRDWLDHGRRPARQAPNQRKGKKTFKQKRAEERHKEVLSEIQKPKQEPESEIKDAKT